MTNRKLKKSVVYGSYCIGLVLLIGVIYLIESNMPKKNFDSKDYSYVSKTIFDDIIPVMNTEDKIIKPFTAEDVQEVKSYYDYKGDAEKQQKSIIYYENTYMQSNGITYGKNDVFDVVAILPGTVEEIKKDELLGTVVTIKHSDTIKSVYQSLGETNINKGDSVIQGQVIGQSGSSNLSKEKENNVYFELLVDNVSVNPTDYFGKTLKEIS